MDAVAYLGRVQADLEPKLVERVAASRLYDRHATLTVLVGSNLLAAHLGRVLARRLNGIFNIRFMTFADAARAVAAAHSGDARRPIPSIAEDVVLDELLAQGEAPEIFERAAGMRGFRAALLATFDDLAEGGCTAEIARRLIAKEAATPRLGGKTVGTLALFGQYRDRVEGLGGDIHSIFRDALEGDVAEALGARVFAYGLYDFNEMQRRILLRIAGTVPLELFVPWDEEAAYRFAARARSKLEDMGVRITALERNVSGRNGGTGGAPHGAAGPANRSGSTVQPLLLNAPGEEEEIREIARRILTLVRDRDMPFADIAIALPSARGYVELAREIFGEAGIPFSSGSRPLMEESAAAKAVGDLLALIEHGIERRGLVEFFMSAPLRAADRSDSLADHLALWVRHSAEAGMVGERGWIEENEALAARIATAVEKGEARRRSLAAVEHADAFLRAIVGAREKIRACSTWTRFSRELSGLARALFEDCTAVEEACGVVESLGELDSLGIGVSPPRFFRAAEAAIEDARTARGRFGTGAVSVLSLGEARGLGFRAVFIPGLAERIFPGPVTQDPFLGDAERGEIERASGGEIALARKIERLSEEALLFALAMESAGEHLCLSYPRFEQGTGKERIPSFFLAFAGFDSSGSGTERRAERISRGTAVERGVELADAEEYDYESARAARAGTGIPPGGRFFTRGARLVRERWGSRLFTPYDGVLSSAEACAEMRSALEEKGYRFAPTALERWAACPFAYFVSEILGGDVLEEPERIVAVTAAQRGTLVHRILARVYKELAEAGLVPVKNAPPETVSAIAERAAAGIIDAFPETEPVGLPVFWEMEKRLVAESIRRFLEEERLEEDDYVPAYFEHAFGRGSDRLAVSHDRGDRFVFFRGRIDRIDVAADGRFRVVDYKTGRLSGKDQDLGSGTALQLPIYLIAAARFLDRGVEEGEAFYRHVGMGDRRSVRFSGSRWSDTLPAFARIIEVVTRGIEEGLFFAPADEQACRICDFRIACGAGAFRLFERKARGDARAGGYLAIRAAAGEES